MEGWRDQWMQGRIGGWIEIKASLRIAYSNQKQAGFEQLTIGSLNSKAPALPLSHHILVYQTSMCNTIVSANNTTLTK